MVSRSDTWCSGSLRGSTRRQTLAQAGNVLNAEHDVHRRATQVAVDQQHPALIRLAERQRQVRRREGLPLSRRRRSQP